MRQRKNHLLFLFTSILSFAGLVLLIIFFSPTYQLTLFSLQIPILLLFFFTLFLFLFSLSTALFKSKTQGILIGLFAASLLLFRLNNLTHPFFFILLTSLFLSLELLFTYRK